MRKEYFYLNPEPIFQIDLNGTICSKKCSRSQIFHGVLSTRALFYASRSTHYWRKKEISSCLFLNSGTEFVGNWRSGCPLVVIGAGAGTGTGTGAGHFFECKRNEVCNSFQFWSARVLRALDIKPKKLSSSLVTVMFDTVFMIYPRAAMTFHERWSRNSKL